MNPTIFNMREVAAHDHETDEASTGLIDKLTAGLLSLPEAIEADDVRDRADAYEESQPSFAAELRAAVTPEEAEALA